MTERSTVHSTFVIERTYPASPARVFKAWADPQAKARWFVGPDEWQSSDHELDFRVGGREHVSGGPPGGPVHSFDARYQDIVPDRRIIYSYDMHMNETRISVSLATVELEAAGEGTRLIFTEQAVYLDGADTAAEREHGTRALLDNLGAALQRETGRDKARAVAP
jgi:uncharacterized protein YndB with AHSA1/START domain